MIKRLFLVHECQIELLLGLIQLSKCLAIFTNILKGLNTCLNVLSQSLNSL